MKSVLSVQSHVAHGYVGNKAATFPLQYLGWNVDTINTVNFSNHTGYGSVKGSAINVTDMTNIFKGLYEIQCTHNAIILGYIPSADLIDVLASNVQRMKTENPYLLCVCDPVMGDQGQLYVDDSCVEAYKNFLQTKKVDIITPNQFELELLCGIKIHSADDLRSAVTHIHDFYGVKYVVVSSLSGNIINGTDDSSLCCAVSEMNTSHLAMFTIPVIKSYFTGVGDLFTALLVDKFFQSNRDISRAVNQVLTIMANVLKLTHTLGVEEFCAHKKISNGKVDASGDFESKMNDPNSMRFFELRIIEAREFYGYNETGSFKEFKI